MVPTAALCLLLPLLFAFSLGNVLPYGGSAQQYYYNPYPSYYYPQYSSPAYYSAYGQYQQPNAAYPGGYGYRPNQQQQQQYGGYQSVYPYYPYSSVQYPYGGSNYYPNRNQYGSQSSSSPSSLYPSQQLGGGAYRQVYPQFGNTQQGAQASLGQPPFFSPSAQPVPGPLEEFDGGLGYPFSKKSKRRNKRTPAAGGESSGQTDQDQQGVDDETQGLTLNLPLMSLAVPEVHVATPTNGCNVQKNPDEENYLMALQLNC